VAHASAKRLGALVLVGAAIAWSGGPASGYARPGVVEQVSLAATGADGNADSGSYAINADSSPLSISRDGNLVAFQSVASNLVTGDLNQNADVFVRDRRHGSTTWVSAPTGGLSASGSAAGAGLCGATGPAISADGRYVAFQSCYAYLDGKPTFPLGDVFVHDLRTKTNVRASVTPSGGLANGKSWQASISADGRYVAFTSQATNLGPKPGCPDDLLHTVLCDAGVVATAEVYVRDLKTKTTRLVSSTAAGQPADGNSNHPSISADGRFVAFTSQADNLASNDNNPCPTYDTPSCPDVFLKDLKTGAVQLVSAGIDGQSPPGTTASGEGRSGSVPVANAISADDRYVVFASDGTDLVPNNGGIAATAGGCTPGYYLRDVRTRRTERVSVDDAGNPLCTDGQSVNLDPSGRFAVFQTACPGRDFVSNPGGYFAADYDVATGGLWLAGSRTSTGASVSCTNSAIQNLFPVVAAGGRYVAFASNQHLSPTSSSSCSTTSAVSVGATHCWDVFVQDGGTALGTATLVHGLRLSVAGVPQFRTTGLIDRSAAFASEAGVSSVLRGAGLIEARVAYRPQTADLFVRLEIADMPAFALADPAMLYGLSFTAGGVSYEVRVAKTSPTGASFGLYRSTVAGAALVASLRGGYGTTGQEVVFSLPLRDIGVGDGGELAGLRAFTAIGSYVAGAVRTVDTIRLSP
jgi:hypothetical protein